MNATTSEPARIFPTAPFVLFTTRTEDPKLRWLQRQLDAAGIPNRRNGSSEHAPILEVPKDKLEDAWALLSRVDEVADDDERFLRPFWPLLMLATLSPTQRARADFKQQALAEFVTRYFCYFPHTSFHPREMVVHGVRLETIRQGPHTPEPAVLLWDGGRIHVPSAADGCTGTWTHRALYMLETGSIGLALSTGRYAPAEPAYATERTLYVSVAPEMDVDLRSVARVLEAELRRAQAPWELPEEAAALAEVQDAPIPPPAPPGPSTEEKHRALAAIVLPYFHRLPRESFRPEDFDTGEVLEEGESARFPAEGVPLCHGDVFWRAEAKGAPAGTWTLTRLYMFADGSLGLSGEWGSYGPTGLTHAEPRQVQHLEGPDMELDLEAIAQVLAGHLARAGAPTEAVDAAQALAQLRAAPTTS